MLYSKELKSSRNSEYMGKYTMYLFSYFLFFKKIITVSRKNEHCALEQSHKDGRKVKGKILF